MFLILFQQKITFSQASFNRASRLKAAIFTSRSVMKSHWHCKHLDWIQVHGGSSADDEASPFLWGWREWFFWQWGETLQLYAAITISLSLWVTDMMIWVIDFDLKYPSCIFIWNDRWEVKDEHGDWDERKWWLCRKRDLH